MEYLHLVWIAAALILACYKVKGSGKDKQEKLKNVSQRPTGEEASMHRPEVADGG